MQLLFYGIIIIQCILVAFAMHFILRLLLVFIGWNQQLPFVPTTNKSIRAIIDDGVVADKQIIIDLGSGTGTMLAQLRKAYPNAQLIGVEQSWWLVLLSRLRFFGRKNVPQFVHGDMFEYDISEADAVIGFWITSLLPRLQEKFVSELKNDSVVVSNVFEFPEYSDFNSRVITHSKKGKVFVYTKL